MPCVREQGRPFRDEVTAVLGVFLRAAGVPKRRDVVPAQTLLEDRIEVRQRRPVLVSGQAVRADHGVEFCLRPLLHVWVQGHGKKECFDNGKRLRERQRSCERAAAHARSLSPSTDCICGTRKGGNGEVLRDEMLLGGVYARRLFHVLQNRREGRIVPATMSLPHVRQSRRYRILHTLEDTHQII